MRLLENVSRETHKREREEREYRKHKQIWQHKRRRGQGYEIPRHDPAKIVELYLAN